MGKDLRGKEIGEGISQRKDGLYYARIGIGGKTIGKCFRKVSDAKKWRVEQNYKKSFQNLRAGSNTLFGQWFEYWIDTIKGNNIEYQTYSCYRRLYQNYIEEYMGDMPLSSILPVHCVNVLLQMSNNGYADSTIRKTRVLMREVFESALENELILKNPITKSVKAKGRKSNEKYVMSFEEEKRFISAIADFPNRRVFEFILETGVRYGELIGLKWEDIDIRNGYFNVKRSLYWLKEEKRYVEKLPKSRTSVRMVPLSERAIVILKEQKEIDKALPVVLGYQNYIFRNSNGNPHNKTTLNKSLKSVMKQLHLPPISIHGLRHAFATRCIENGMKPKTLQKILGHSTLSVTMDLYVHITDTEMIKEFKAFETKKAVKNL